MVTEPFFESFSGDRILAMIIAKILALPRDPRESKRDPREAKKQPPEARKWYHNRFFKSLPGVRILAMIIAKNLALQRDPRESKTEPREATATPHCIYSHPPLRFPFCVGCHDGCNCI